MELDPELMGQYADFLEEFSEHITGLCRQMEELSTTASQCMDQLTGLKACRSLIDNMENIIANVPVADDACQRLILAIRRIAAAREVFEHGR